VGEQRILIAEDDAWMLRMMTIVLERRGFRVEGVTDGETAFARAIEEPPDLIITDALMPQLDGWTLIKRLRENPELALVPVIFVSALSSDDDRMRGFRLGADAYISKPFRFEELDLRVTSALRRARPGGGGELRASRPMLRGDLDQIAVTTVLTLVEQERKTGRRVARRQSGVTIELMVREGRIVQAHRPDRPEVDDRACVQELLAWRGGELEMIQCSVDGADRVAASMTQLLLELAVAADQAAR